MDTIIAVIAAAILSYFLGRRHGILYERKRVVEIITEMERETNG